MGPRSGDVRKRGEGAIHISCRGRGSGQAAIASACSPAPSCTHTREIGQLRGSMDEQIKIRKSEEIGCVNKNLEKSEDIGIFGG